jgi:hypothetical protein
MDEWLELREALAWIVTRDEEFMREMRETFADLRMEDSNWFILDRLEPAMEQAGCVIKQSRRVRVQFKDDDPDIRIDEKGFEHSLDPQYQGSWRPLAEAYDTAKRKVLCDDQEAEADAGAESEADDQEDKQDPLTLFNFLRYRLVKAGTELAKKASEGKLQMRDAHGNVPPELAHTLGIGIVGDPSWFLPDGQMIDATGKVRGHITVHREDLLKCFPRVLTEHNAKSLCQRWLEEEMRKSPHRSPKPRKEFQTEAMQKWPGLSGRKFNNPWDAAIPPTGAKWNQAGRPPKKFSH